MLLCDRCLPQIHLEFVHLKNQSFEEGKIRKMKITGGCNHCRIYVTGRCVCLLSFFLPQLNGKRAITDHTTLLNIYIYVYTRLCRILYIITGDASAINVRTHPTLRAFPFSPLFSHTLPSFMLNIRERMRATRKRACTANFHTRIVRIIPAVTQHAHDRAARRSKRN